MNRYRVFNICLLTELEIPGLAHCHDAEAEEWSVFVRQSEFDAVGFEHVHTWNSERGEALMTCSRRGEDYLLEVMGLVRFLLHFDKQQVSAFPSPECTDATVAHLLLDQVLPRVLCHLGHVIVHASAVQLESGPVIAFSGPSGRGKSTLATALFNAGHRVFADDCLLLEIRDGSVYAIPAYPSLRLWPDAAEHLLDKDEREFSSLTEMAHYTRKKQLLFRDSQRAGHGQAIRLGVLFILGEPGHSDPDNQEVHIRAAGGMQSMVALVESLFALDVRRKTQVERNFRRLGEIANFVQVCQLEYPRNYDQLPNVVKEVLEKTAVCG